MKRGRPKKYINEEEKKESLLENARRWVKRNPEKAKESKRRYYQNNIEHYKEYRSTQKGRAIYLLSRYRRSDKEKNRGECTLTVEWIIENIFSKPCHYCGESDWHNIGCDRIDNSLPHTPENVVPCCTDCNKERNQKSYEEFLKQKNDCIRSNLTQPFWLVY